jgi:hypothetical protein
MNAWIIVGLLVLLAHQQSPDSAPKAAPVTTTICAILAEPSKYDQVMVTIRGTFVYGDELAALEDRSCTNVLRTDDHVWPPRIWLTVPTKDARLPPGYTYDRSASERFGAALRKAGAMHESPRIVVTVTGKIDARQSYFGRRFDDGFWIGNGFGHENQCAAQLVQSSVTDWEITPGQQVGGETKKP